MPRPVYIICSESGAEDTQTGLLSLFNLIEQLEIRRIPPPPPGHMPVIRTHKMRVVAAWRAESSDSPEQEFEFQTVFHLPSNREEIAHEGKFIFVEEKPFYRITLFGQGPPFEGPGTFRIESRLRKAGESQWTHSQDYVMDVVEGEPISANPPV